MISTLFPLVLLASGGSVYTRFSLGDIVTASSARRMAMGGLGASLEDYEYLSSYNPASYSRLDITRIETGLDFKGVDAKDNNSSAFYSNANFSGFSIGMPLQHDWGMSLVGGMLPVTRSQYEVKNAKTLDQLDYSQENNRIGGLSKAFIGISYNLPFDLALGATYSYLVGNLRSDFNTTFPEGSGFTSSYSRVNYELRGQGFSAGLISPDFMSLLGSNSRRFRNLRLGLTFEYFGKIKADTNYSIKQTQYEVLTSGKTDFQVPYKLGVGASFILQNNYQLALDYLYSPYSDYKMSGLKDRNLRDYQKISLGMEYKDRTSRSKSWEDEVMMRCGLSYEATQYKILGRGIDQYSVYGGFSLPLSFETTLDFALQWGIRGTRDLGLTREQFINAQFSLSFGELWFSRIDR